MSDIARFPYINPIEENIKSVTGMPFYLNLEYQAHILNYGLKIDYLKLENILINEPESRALSVLKYQLERYKKIFSGMVQ